MTYLLATNGIILLLDPFSFPGNAGRGSAAKDQRVETAPENVLHAITEVMRQNEATKHNRKSSSRSPLSSQRSTHSGRISRKTIRSVVPPPLSATTTRQRVPPCMITLRRWCLTGEATDC